jgi:SAM-dependent methyltransferase
MIRRLRRTARRVASRFVRNERWRTIAAVERYQENGRVPWSAGYTEVKRRAIAAAIGDRAVVERFASRQPLPAGFGARIDERIVEFPWVLSKLPDGPARLLDAGATLNHVPILKHPRMAEKRLLFVALAPTHVEVSPGVSYLYDDLRHLIVRDDVFDVVTCISTLEHVGLDNTQLYIGDPQYAEHDLDGYVPALHHLRRVLKPGGRLLLTVPYGRAEDHGWLQQFDGSGIERVKQAFGGQFLEETYYRYSSDGWQLAPAEACADATYYDYHADPTPQPDGAGAARAVCCLELRRP